MTFEKVMEDINALESVDDQMEVLAELYFAFYHKNIKEVMASNVITCYRKEAEEDLAKMKKEVDALLNERDLLKRNFLKKHYPDSPAKIQRFFECLPEENQKAIKDEIKEDLFYSHLKIECQTRKKRIEILEREMDYYILKVRELNRENERLKSELYGDNQS